MVLTQHVINVLDKWLRKSWSFRIIIHSNSRKVLRRNYSTTAVSVLRFCSDPQQASSYVMILPGVQWKPRLLYSAVANTNVVVHKALDSGLYVNSIYQVPCCSYIFTRVKKATTKSKNQKFRTFRKDQKITEVYRRGRNIPTLS